MKYVIARMSVFNEFLELKIKSSCNSDSSKNENDTDENFEDIEHEIKSDGTSIF